MVSISSILVGLVLSVASTSASLESLATFDIPVFDYATVQQGDSPTRVLEALQADGIIALKNISNYANLRERYLGKAAGCAAVTEDTSLVTRKLFEDDTKRFTISTNAGRDLMGSASATDVLCPGYRQLYEEFSQTMERAVNTFGNTLPSRQLISNAVRLDHFHAYEAAPSPASESNARNLALSLPLHEDHGLFIAMAAPKLFEVEQTSRQLVERELAADASGLVIQLSTGDRVRPVLKGDELVLMMGTGATRWLQTSHPLPAVLHGMKMPSVATEDDTRRLRAWFGKMTLLPAYQRMLLGEGALFEDHVNATRRHLMDTEPSDLKTVGCASGRQLQASTKCTHRQCKTKSGATPSAPCDTLCNRQGHGAGDADECAQRCDCVTGGSGDMCWMLCVANLPVNECPLDKQKCDETTQVMQCLAPVPAPVTPSPPSTSAPTTKAPQPSPTTATPVTNLPTTDPTTSSPTTQTGSNSDATTEVPSTETPTSDATSEPTTLSDSSVSEDSSQSSSTDIDASDVEQIDPANESGTIPSKTTKPPTKNAAGTTFVMTSVAITVAAVVASLL